MYFTVEHLYANTVPEHQELLELLRRGDAESVEQHTRYYLKETARVLLQFLAVTH